MRVCNFLLVTHSTIGPVLSRLSRFRDIVDFLLRETDLHPNSIRIIIMGVFPLDHRLCCG